MQPATLTLPQLPFILATFFGELQGDCLYFLIVRVASHASSLRILLLLKEPLAHEDGSEIFRSSNSTC